MSFLDLPCEYLSVDALDVLGSNRVNITGMHTIHYDSLSRLMRRENIGLLLYTDAPTFLVVVRWAVRVEKHVSC